MKYYVFKLLNYSKQISKSETIPYCENPAIRPTYVENGEWKSKDCNINKGKTRCDLTCDEGHIPDGNGKWVCENNKITHPVHSCVRVAEPMQNSDCRTPHLTHGVYACSWNKVCHGSDDHHVHRRDDDGDDRGGKHKKHHNDHDHTNTKNMCTRECTLQCDVGWVPLSGSNTAICVRHTREWIEKSTICVPDNYKHDKHSKGWKGEGDEPIDDQADRMEPEAADVAEPVADVAEPTSDVAEPTAPKPAETKPTETKPESDDDDDDDEDGKACALAQENDKDTGWGYGQCPEIGSEDQPCLPKVPLFDEGKEKTASSKIYWDCNGSDKGSTCKAVCGPSAIPTENSVMTCVCKTRSNNKDTKNLMCSWSGKIKDHCRRKLFDISLVNKCLKLFI